MGRLIDNSFLSPERAELDWGCGLSERRPEGVRVQEGRPLGPDEPDSFAGQPPDPKLAQKPLSRAATRQGISLLRRKSRSEIALASARPQVTRAGGVEKVAVQLRPALIGMNVRAARQAAAQTRLPERKPPHQVAEYWQRERHPIARMAGLRKAGLSD